MRESCRAPMTNGFQNASLQWIELALPIHGGKLPIDQSTVTLTGAVQALSSAV